MLGTVYHEARHAEQYFDAVRVAARRFPKASAARLAQWIASTGAYVPPLRIIEAARRCPAPPGEGDTWFGLYFGEKAETDYRLKQAMYKIRAAEGRALNAKRLRREAIRKKMRENGEGDMDPQVIKDFDEHFKRRWVEIYKAYEAYDQLPDELDADDAKKKAIDAISSAP